MSRSIRRIEEVAKPPRRHARRSNHLRQTHGRFGAVAPLIPRYRPTGFDQRPVGRIRPAAAVVAPMESPQTPPV